MPLRKYSRNEDNTYGPNTLGEYYVSKADHRKTAKPKKGKTKWKILEGEEFSVFIGATESNQLGACKKNNCVFGIVDKASVILGINGERIAKFPNDRNDGEPWHGYPVLTEEAQNRPSSELLDAIPEEILPHSVRIKIERGQI
jgi:hypothetical protein